jgi:hypothetical protein
METANQLNTLTDMLRVFVFVACSRSWGVEALGSIAMVGIPKYTNEPSLFMAYGCERVLCRGW